MNVSYDDNETEILSREDGRIIAENYCKKGQRDPLRYGGPALLSADEIVDYVKKTGAISPFYRGGKHSRLKKASYEGRIGEKAYKYDDNRKLTEMTLKDGQLTVQANSIVFVESDLDFRLPDFIALRFNLQIRHVHRGLLLGTGPLVDPGFWGKLCIPLHNLTNEDYHIPKEEGLIWVELTKTSGAVGYGRNALDSKVNKSKKGYWNIREDYIEKAARPFDETKPTYSIQSSIPFVAKEAREDAKKSAESANKSAETVEKIRGYSIVAIAAFLISVFVLFRGFYANVTGIYNSIVPEIREKVDSAMRKTTANSEKMDANSKIIYDQINDLVSENEKLRQENIEIRERILHLEHLANQ